MKRNLDQLGRVVIPVEMRRELELSLGDEVNIEIDNDKIIITNPNNKKFDLKTYLKDKIIELENNPLRDGGHTLNIYIDIYNKCFK